MNEGSTGDRASWEELLSGFNESIRGGNAAKVRAALKTLSAKQVPRFARARLANLARRAGKPEFAIRLLNPIVYPLKPGDGQATARERLEYGATLSRIGANSEALEILRAVRPEDEPDVDLYLSIALFSRWEYQAAIPLLRRFEKSTGDEYQRWVSWVNLSAALLFERQVPEALETLSKVQEETGKKGARLLYCNSLELKAQAHLQRGEFSESRACLNEGMAKLGSPDLLDAYFFRKWEAVVELKESQGSASAIENLRRIRQEAVERKHWESIRDCDFQLAIVRRDTELLLHLYFGAPNPGYRRHVLDSSPVPLAIPERYAWNPSGRTGASQTVDVSAGTATTAGARRGSAELYSLHPGGVLHRMLASLSSDFYRPLRVPALFSAVFEGEHYHPEHSVTKTVRAIQRLRDWFGQTGLSLAVTADAGFYGLGARTPTGADLIVRREEPSEKRAAAMTESIRVQLRKPQGAALADARGFTASDAARALGISKRSAARVLKAAAEGGAVSVSGVGRATRYRFQ